MLPRNHLDRIQVSFDDHRRHITLAMLAHAYLSVMAMEQGEKGAATGRTNS